MTAYDRHFCHCSHSCRYFFPLLSLTLKTYPSNPLALILSSFIRNILGNAKNKNLIQPILFQTQNENVCLNHAKWRCELTPYSQRAHVNYLTVGSFGRHSISSQWSHKISSHCELAVSFPWVCNSCNELTASTAWLVHRMISWIGHSKLTM